MPTSANPVSARLRADTEEIVQRWEREIAGQIPQLARLERRTVIDHIPEFLVGLAAWLEGDEESGRRGFDALVHGHALQRLGHGVELSNLTTEYQVLRLVILEHLLELEATRQVFESLIRLNVGLDYAVNDAIRSYTKNRDVTRERFISILGHDLRNPLNAVALATETILATPCNDPRHQRLATTGQRSADRMGRMIADVIDFAHAHLGGGIPAVPSGCNMGLLCEEAAAELRLTHPERVIRVATAGDLDGAWDRDRVLQAISNLIGNAIQHGLDPIEVSARESPEHDAVVTVVRNRGAAIPTGQLDRLFDPFRQGASAARPRSSLGLGLYIVQQIAIAHGAVCTVHSDAETTAFEIVWPRARLDEHPRT